MVLGDCVGAGARQQGRWCSEAAVARARGGRGRQRTTEVVARAYDAGTAAAAMAQEC